MSLQLCNVQNVNSVYNTMVFAIFKAGDNPFNLHVALQQYRKEIQDMETAQWQ